VMFEGNSYLGYIKGEHLVKQLIELYELNLIAYEESYASNYNMFQELKDIILKDQKGLTDDQRLEINRKLDEIERLLAEEDYSKNHLSKELILKLFERFLKFSSRNYLASEKYKLIYNLLSKNKCFFWDSDLRSKLASIKEAYSKFYTQESVFVELTSNSSIKEFLYLKHKSITQKWKEIKEKHSYYRLYDIRGFYNSCSKMDKFNSYTAYIIQRNKRNSNINIMLIVFIISITSMGFFTEEIIAGIILLVGSVFTFLIWIGIRGSILKKELKQTRLAEESNEILIKEKLLTLQRDNERLCEEANMINQKKEETLKKKIFLKPRNFLFLKEQFAKAKRIINQMNEESKNLKQKLKRETESGKLPANYVSKGINYIEEKFDGTYFPHYKLLYVLKTIISRKKVDKILKYQDYQQDGRFIEGSLQQLMSIDSDMADFIRINLDRNQRETNFKFKYSMEYDATERLQEISLYIQAFQNNYKHIM